MLDPSFDPLAGLIFASNQAPRKAAAPRATTLRPSALVSPEARLRRLNDAAHRRLDEGFPSGIADVVAIKPLEWIVDSCVVLIDEQECRTCGSRHSYSHGFFTGSHHVRDKTAHKLTAGKPVGYFPSVTKRVNKGFADVCGNCAESQRMIDDATERAA